MMDTNVLDRLLDRIQQQERDKLRLQRRLGRMAFHRNRAESSCREMERVVAESKEVSEKAERDLNEALVEELEADIERLRTQSERRTELHKEAVARYEAELSALREQRDRLVSDNTALATARDEYRKAKHELEQDLASEAEQRGHFEGEMEHALTQAGAASTIGGFIDRVRDLAMQAETAREIIAECRKATGVEAGYNVVGSIESLKDELRQLKDAHAERKEEYMMLSQARHDLEDELRQVQHTLSMEQDLIRELHRDVKLHKDYAHEVWKHSFTVHAAACRDTGLDEDWHQSGPATQGEADDG